MERRDAVDWYEGGIIFHRSGNYEKAIQCYDRALERDPKHATAWNNKGLALYNLGRYDEAIQCYDRALVIDPEYASAKNNRDNALRKRGTAAKSTNQETSRKAVDIKSTSGSSRPGKIEGPTQSPAHSAEPVKTRSPITIERTIYDPLTQDFNISSPRSLINVRDWINSHDLDLPSQARGRRTLANVRDWINRHDPSSYWLVICVHNHGSHPIDEWGIELESASALQILETGIAG